MKNHIPIALFVLWSLLIISSCTDSDLTLVVINNRNTPIQVTDDYGAISALSLEYPQCVIFENSTESYPGFPENTLIYLAAYDNSGDNCTRGVLVAEYFFTASADISDQVTWIVD